MLNRFVAVTLALCLAAAGCKSFDPWQDTLENPEVLALKSEYGGPMKFKAAVGLRIDQASFARAPSDEIAALKADVAELALAVRAAQDAVSRGSKSAASPDDLIARLESLSAAAAEIRAALNPDAVARIEAVNQALKSAGLAETMVSALAPKLSAKDADLAALVQPLADAASEFSTASMLASSLAETLMSAGDPAAEALTAAAEASSGALNQLLLAAQDVEELRELVEREAP